MTVMPSLFLIAPEIAPRTECVCHPVAFDRASMVAPLVLRNMPKTIPSLLSGRWARTVGSIAWDFEACFVVRCTAGLVLPNFLAAVAGFAAFVGFFMMVSVG